MKVCNKCKIEKNLDEFNNNKKKPDGKQLACRECTKKQHIDWYHKNQGAQVERNKKVFKIKNDNYIELKKTLSCVKCSENRYYLLDFHHLDPNLKDFTIGSRVNGGIKRLQDEINKCIVLCSNCHREFHHLERAENIKIEDYIK